MSTNSATIYLKAEQNIEVQTTEVCVKDIATLTCADSHVLAKAKSLKLWTFREGESKRQVISMLKVIEEIEKACPGASVENLGETDVLVEWIRVDRHKGFVQWCKLAFVALISFFGTAFTIMAFHNDIGINEVFSKIYEMVMGAPGRRLRNSGTVLLGWAGGGYHRILQSHRRQADHERSHTHRGGNAGL